jgi:quercetin dioxygenase-like cupin family protein
MRTMFKTTRARLLALVVIAGAIAAGSALGTPSSGVVAETARGQLDRRLQENTTFDNGARVKLNTKGPIEVVIQRIVAVPGATFGWHTHPGENVNVMLAGTLTLYHDEHCTKPIPYSSGDSFATSPEDVHLARNEGTETVVFFATYFVPKTDPPVPIRIDQPSPGPNCPQ